MLLLRAFAVSCLLSFLILPSFAVASDPPLEIPLEFTPARVHHTEITDLGDGAYELRTTGIDSYLEFDLPEIADPEAAPVLAFDYFSTTGIEAIEIRLAGRGDWQPVIDAGGLDPAEGWTPTGLSLVEPGNAYWNQGRTRRLRIDWGQVPERRIRIRAWRLRSLTEEERESTAAKDARRAVSRQRAEAIDKYLSRATTEEGFPAAITTVAIDEQEIVVTGTIPNDGRPYSLAEVTIDQSPAVPGPRATVMTIDSGAESGNPTTFRMAVPRFDDRGRDRLTSRWQVVLPGPTEDPFTTASAARYATDLSGMGAPDLAAPPQLRAAKGMGGVSPVFGLEELVELGVRHVTVNTLVTDLVFDSPRGGADETFEHNGRTWWLNTRRLAHADQIVRFASENDIVVALIILLPQRSSDSIVHPDATSNGIYGMPHLDDAETAAKYSAALAALASRYSGGDRGRVDHWIMHNEVDYGWIWTNMGEKPLEVYMDSLVRSMRIAYLQARQYNPHAEVFISLTHNWNVPEDSRWRTYPPRRMLEMLAKMTASEGPFDWGVAYHPYPQDLFNPRTWEDTRVSDDFDTELITMKNIEVLERFLQQPEMRNEDGSVRTVLLSEQGYHTDGYDEEAQRLQAAALLYTWERLESVECVYAYDYHRWVDSTGEGGLLLGLRTVPEADHPAGKPKLGLEVFQAIGTEQEDSWRRQMESIYRE